MQILTCNLFSSLFREKVALPGQDGVKMLYGSMFPSSLLAMSRISSHSADACTNDSKSHKAFNFLYVWSDIKPAAHMNWKTPKWSWKSSVRAFPTCIYFPVKLPTFLYESLETSSSFHMKKSRKYPLQEFIPYIPLNWLTCLLSAFETLQSLGPTEEHNVLNKELKIVVRTIWFNCIDQLTNLSFIRIAIETSNRQSYWSWNLFKPA